MLSTGYKTRSSRHELKAMPFWGENAALVAARFACERVSPTQTWSPCSEGFSGHVVLRIAAILQLEWNTVNLLIFRRWKIRVGRKEVAEKEKRKLAVCATNDETRVSVDLYIPTVFWTNFRHKLLSLDFFFVRGKAFKPSVLATFFDFTPPEEHFPVLAR